jgi:WxL domain surface cell wall-binding
MLCQKTGRRMLRHSLPMRAHARRSLAVCVVALAAYAVVPVATEAATGTATISAGTLGFVSTPPNVGFSATLNGADQTVTTTQALDVADATGSGAGWNLTATSTTFTTGGGSPHLLATSATTIAAAPAVACDTGSTCTAATNSVTFPYTLPAGATAPTATKLFNAAANSGMGNQTVTPTWRLSVPASTFAGTYTSTWTISLVSGP